LLCPKLISELLNELYLLWSPEKLYIRDSLLYIIGYFIQARMIIGPTERPIDTDEIHDALFLAAVLSVTMYREVMT
jgi:hypothetical protein